MKLLEKYQVVLFDLHGVLMFGHDRFGAEQDFYRTYHALGGRGLSADQVQHFISRCYEGMRADYHDPARYDDFPSLREGLSRFTDAPASELALLELVFSLHECGLVPTDCADLLTRLARTHRLGLVSNIWGPKFLWQREFERAGISDLFQHVVFSSDWRSVKPSSKLFHEALKGVHASAEDVLFVGDNLRCDMEGAKQLGMGTAWISELPGSHASVDYRLRCVFELESLPV